jgi:hypothetical protein
MQADSTIINIAFPGSHNDTLAQLHSHHRCTSRSESLSSTDGIARGYVTCDTIYAV